MSQRRLALISADAVGTLPMVLFVWRPQESDNLPQRARLYSSGT